MGADQCPLKAADRSGQAFEQIKQYERDIPRLFYSNAFNIVTDGMATLYGATGAPAKFYAPWPDPFPFERSDFTDDLTKDMYCLLEPARLLDLLAHFIVFETDPDTGRRIKKVCRYQQFRAVNKAVNRVADAVRDGATVPILYEGRKTEWSINEAEIDILFDRWFVDLSDEKREKLKQKGVSLALIAKHPERIRLIARDIWEHFKQTCRPDGFKAQIVAIDRESVVLYRLALAKVIADDFAKDGMDEADALAKADSIIACVFSKSPEDDKPSENADVEVVRAELRARYLDADGEKAAKKAFKGSGDEPSFLIVCDKLLTGFDAPNEHVMYLDKPLREHGLLQAIARTNRTCSIKRPDGSTVDKPHGRIVDYIGVTQNLDDALSSYRADDVQNALRDLDLLRRDLRKTHAEFKRQLRLTVRRHDGANVEVAYRNGFFVDLPLWVGDVERERVVANELKLWLKRRARADVLECAADCRKQLGLTPQSIRVAEMKNGWGACGKAGNILINWALILGPKSVLRYVIFHEFAHLRVRSHGPEFWEFLGSVHPEYHAAKAWLERNGASLDTQFLGTPRSN